MTRLRAIVALAALALAGCGSTQRAVDPLRAGDLALAARFPVVDGALGEPIAGDARPVAEGRRLWAELQRIAAPDVRRRLSGFAVYLPVPGTNAFTRVDERGDGWLVGVAPGLDGPLVETVILHELAHVATLDGSELDAAASTCTTYRSPFGCARPGSCLARWVEAFWSPARGGPAPGAGNAFERLAAHPGAFLGLAGAISPEEDVATVWAALRTGHPLSGPTLAAKAQAARDCPPLAALARQTTVSSRGA